MEAKQLRIGNLVQDFECEPYIFEIEKISKEWIVYRKGSIKTREATPIPLTEEWLIRFNFERQDNNWNMLCICNDWTYLYWEKLAGVQLSINKHSIMLPHIQYVHQFQNLYHSLCGEELILKEQQ